MTLFGRKKHKNYIEYLRFMIIAEFQNIPFNAECQNIPFNDNRKGWDTSKITKVSMT